MRTQSLLVLRCVLPCPVCVAALLCCVLRALLVLRVLLLQVLQLLLLNQLLVVHEFNDRARCRFGIVGHVAQLVRAVLLGLLLLQTQQALFPVLFLVAFNGLLQLNVAPC